MFLKIINHDKTLSRKESDKMNDHLLIALNKLKEKKTSTDDVLILQSMNMTHPQMTLSENHKLIIEVFDKFNQIIGTNFDSYYTGGLMAYLATNHPLERYHSDLDLYINEDQLFSLYELVSQDEDFEFISNIDHKRRKGHEFKIQYKGTSMSIGLYLFERKPNNEIVIKEYYYSNNDPSTELLVDEQHLAPNYAKMIFANDIKLHNNIPYRMQTLEIIYNYKKNSRPKDKYDADIIKDKIDLTIDYNLDTQTKDNYCIKGKNADYSVVAQMKTFIGCYDIIPYSLKKTI